MPAMFALPGADAARLRRGIYLHLACEAGRFRNGIAKLPQRFQMAMDRFANIELRFVERVPGGHAPREIGDI